ncbi:hypothetical protein VNO77_17526 [Canavalia gladiata]|uniref:Uncharacterized protein n=1 Tax=Canavalia gladiata TaxID=3824 RepID=A0AAN9LJ50_CANGL
MRNIPRGLYTEFHVCGFDVKDLDLWRKVSNITNKIVITTLHFHRMPNLKYQVKNDPQYWSDFKFQLPYPIHSIINRKFRWHVPQTHRGLHKL